MKFIAHFTPIINKTKHGFKIMALKSDINMRRYLYEYGTRDEHVTHMIQSLVRSGDIVLDIGANIGFETMIFSQIVGETGKVYSFEPSKTIYNILEQNIHNINTFDDNIVLMDKGVGSKTETVKLYMDKKNPGGSSICHNYGLGFEEINIITIDSLKLKKVDFIKMDIEGYEYEAFLGMKHVLEQNKNLKIIFEWSPAYYQDLTNDGRPYSIKILKYLSDHGFTLYVIDSEHLGKKHKITDFEKTYDETVKFHAHADIFAIKE